MSYPTHIPWRIECRGCGAWLVTPLPEDVQSWMNGHKHEPARAAETKGGKGAVAPDETKRPDLVTHHEET